MTPEVAKWTVRRGELGYAALARAWGALYNVGLPFTIAKLVQIASLMVYDTYITYNNS